MGGEEGSLGRGWSEGVGFGGGKEGCGGRGEGLSFLEVEVGVGREVEWVGRDASIC